MVELITDNLPAITDLCRKHGVRKLEVFGSSTSDRFDPDTSDVDFVIDFLDYGPGVADRFFRFAEEVETLLGRSADFIFGDKPIKNPYLRESVNESRETVFEAIPLCGNDYRTLVTSLERAIESPMAIGR